MGSKTTISLAQNKTNHQQWLPTFTVEKATGKEDTSNTCRV